MKYEKTIGVFSVLLALAILAMAASPFGAQAAGPSAQSDQPEINEALTLEVGPTLIWADNPMKWGNCIGCWPGERESILRLYIPDAPTYPKGSDIGYSLFVHDHATFCHYWDGSFDNLRDKRTWTGNYVRAAITRWEAGRYTILSVGPRYRIVEGGEHGVHLEEAPPHNTVIRSTWDDRVLWPEAGADKGWVAWTFEKDEGDRLLHVVADYPEELEGVHVVVFDQKGAASDSNLGEKGPNMSEFTLSEGQYTVKIDISSEAFLTVPVNIKTGKTTVLAFGRREVD